MEDKDLLMKAIDNYALLPATGRILLKTLINLAVDDVVIITIKELSHFAKISRPAVYANLKLLEDNQIIERQVSPGSRLSSFLLKPHKFNGIIEHYKARKNFLNNQEIH